MDTVLRVEHVDTRKGPYRGGGIPKEVNQVFFEHTHYNGHPNARHDGGIMRQPYPDEFFGFGDMDQLLNWFIASEMDLLFRHHYVVVELTQVEITAIGNKQVLFTTTKETKREILYSREWDNGLSYERSQKACEVHTEVDADKSFADLCTCKDTSLASQYGIGSKSFISSTKENSPEIVSDLWVQLVRGAIEFCFGPE